MKTHITLRKGVGYCCQRCDGPYNKWKNKRKRSLKKRDKNNIKRQLEKELNGQNTTT